MFEESVPAKPQIAPSYLALSGNIIVATNLSYELKA